MISASYSGRMKQETSNKLFPFIFPPLSRVVGFNISHVWFILFVRVCVPRGCKCCEMLVCRHNVLMSKAKEFLESAVELELLPMLPFLFFPPSAMQMPLQSQWAADTCADSSEELLPL